MKKEKKEHINIANNVDLVHLIERIKNGPQFAETFSFENEKQWFMLIQYLGIEQEEYEKNYFFFDKERNIHISSSEFDYVWISTYGLIAKDKATDNKYVNAFMNQYTVIELIFEKAIAVSEEDKIYDVDGYYFGYLSKLTPALFHNLLFFVEVFCKAYLSLSGKKVPHSHILNELFPIVIETMYEENHNNTMFQAFMITSFRWVVDYVSTIPGGFKEHFVKYDDNEEDGTIIEFDTIKLKEIRDTLNTSYDFISGYYYDGKECMYLKPKLYERLLENAETEEDRKRVKETHGYLLEKN